MTKFKDLLSSGSFYKKIEAPSVELSSAKTGHSLSLRFNSKDQIIEVSYQGKRNGWFESMCFLLVGKTLKEAEFLNLDDWKKEFQEDPSFWESYQDEILNVFCEPLELLHACLDIYKGREYLYEEASPLICRCFGVRENDVKEFLRKEKDPSLENIGLKTKAGMGCRSCVPQLEKWLTSYTAQKKTRYYKNRPLADWAVTIDSQLSLLPEASLWKMEVESLNGNMVIIKYDKEVTQFEEEEMMKKLQDFLGAAVDTGFGFFLKRTRHL